MNATTEMSPARFSIALNVATTLRREGVDVITSDFGGDSIRVDVRSKASTVKAKDMLSAAGFSNVRALFERRGLWLVVATVSAKR